MRLERVASIWLGATLVFLLLNGCATLRFSDGPDSTSSLPLDSGDSGRPEFILIYMIHGDGNYSYYNRAGTKHWADLDALSEAFRVAELSRHAEVLIFHQKSRQHFFSRKAGGMFYRFSGGKKVSESKYYRYAHDSGLTAEASLFNGLHLRVPIKVFLYFGHEIIAEGGRGYSASYPDGKFSLMEFSNGLREFSKSYKSVHKPISMVVLSACHGGNQSTGTAVAPFTDLLVASPTLLHLSYLNSNALGSFSSSLDHTLENSGIMSLADSIAQQSFTRLQAATQTEIGIVILSLETQKNPTTCVKLLYQPARFGRPDAAARVHDLGCPVN